MSRWLRGWVGIVAVAAALVVGSPGESAQLLECGTFHQGEVRARSGLHWLALIVSPHGSRLVPVRATIRRAYDPIVDPQPRVRTGKRVTVDRKGDAPVLLVRGERGLHAGTVTTVEAKQRSLDDGPVRMMLRGREYRLALLRKRAGSMRGARLVLSSGRARQVLYSLSPKWHGTDPTWTLLWAGDLDGDGKLDLYVEVADDEDVSDRRLYLSSHAGKAHLLRKARRFYLIGC